MEPAVPFALLGAVTLLSVAAWACLAAAALAPGHRRVVPAVLLVCGAVVLAVVDTLTGLRSGQAASDLLAVARAAGLLLVGGSLYAGALPRPLPVGAAGARPAPRVLPDGAAVVVPLAAAPAPAALAAAAGVAASLAALRGGRDLAGGLLAAGLLAGAASSALAPLADDGASRALGVLGLRGVAAVLVLGGLLALARSSLLAKVVAAILAGVLAMAAAAVGVVGTTVTRAFEREQAALVRDAADGRVQLLDRVLDRNAALTSVVAGACTQRPESCDSVLAQLSDSSSSFALLVREGTTPQVLAGADTLSTAEALGLAGSEAVRAASEGGAGAVAAALPARVRLAGAQPGLALVVVAPQGRPTPTAQAPAAFVFGTRVDDVLVDQDVGTGGYGLTLLVGGEVVASTLPAAAQERLVRVVGARGDALPRDGVTVAAEGRSPTVHLRPLLGVDEQAVATLALSRDPEVTQRAQRDALRALLLTALLTTAVVAGLALLLGRRTVDPVRRLTAAAERVTAGDLSVAVAGQAGQDEVGALARAFDTMTGSLAAVTGDLRASNARLETVLSSMSDGLVATDGDDRVTSINRAALVMAGLPDEQAALGRRLGDVLDARDPDGARISAAADLREDAVVEVHTLDGTSTPVQVAVAPLESGTGVVVVLRDTTREREVERMKTEFLSNVSHELRTPLTPIRGYADLLASRRTLTPEQVATFAGTILSESVKMNRVVDLLVDVAAIEAGRVSTSPRPVAPRDLLDARLEVWRARAPERSADLRRRAAARLPHVLVDPVWVAKALDELVDNAVKHTPPGTRILLTAGRVPDGEGVRLAVRDNGPGIASGDQAALLQSFAQVDGSATRRVGGLGLGLSFVHRLAEEAGYRLTVTSTLGKGAEFALDVPTAEAD